MSWITVSVVISLCDMVFRWKLWVYKMLLDSNFRVLYESPDPATVFAYSPGICRLASGRLVATMDQGGPGVKDLPGPKGLRGEGQHAWQGRV